MAKSDPLAEPSKRWASADVGSVAKTDPLVALAAVSPDDLNRKPCLIVRTLATVDRKRAQTVWFLINESGHSAPRISQACKQAGINISPEAIQKHRRRGCPCP